ncbi:MAG: hypothetical protein CW335_03270 [Clostridiales bacterium]|nr:hypothetical protein [Clostridiales bacterium]
MCKGRLWIFRYNRAYYHRNRIQICDGQIATVALLPRNDRTESFSGIIPPRLITGRLPSVSLRADEIGVAIRAFPVSDAVPSYSVVFLFGTRKAPLLKGAVSEAD